MKRVDEICLMEAKNNGAHEAGKISGALEEGAFLPSVDEEKQSPITK